MATNGATPRRLYLFLLSTATVPSPGGPLELTTGCYLVQMSDGENILIDNGDPPGGSPAVPGSEKTYAPGLLEQLAEIGVRPEDVATVVATHFDVDHAGLADAFADAEHVVQRQHYELARGGHPRFAPARAHWDAPGLRYTLVEGDTRLRDGLDLVESSGHTRGHQSVLVRLPETGPVLLAIDAVPLASMFTTDRGATPFDEDLEAARASTRKLIDLAQREGVKLVVFHHDGAQWKALDTAPAWYA